MLGTFEGPKERGERMKASEIFLEYAMPIYASVPRDIDQAELQKALSVPEMVWNAVVLDRNLNRRAGEMPERLKEQLQTIGTRHRKIFRETLRFWVLRKDKMFATFDWPLNIIVYKNIKSELIIRAEVLELTGSTPNVPADWLKQKTPAPVVPLRSK